MGQRELKKWFRDLLANVNDPVRREMHYFTLLTGIRRGDSEINGNRVASPLCGGPTCPLEDAR